MNPSGLTHPRNRYWLDLALLILLQISYWLTNHYHAFQPRLLPVLWIDGIIPFLPWTALIYLSDLPFFFTSYVLLGDARRRSGYIKACATAVGVGCVIFVLWPTAYPRPAVLGLANSPRIAERAYAWLTVADDPSNAFPSLHVACSCLSAFCFLEASQPRWKLSVCATWAILIVASTLTTKQHYFVDIMGGVLLAWCAYRHMYRPAVEQAARTQR